MKKKKYIVGTLVAGTALTLATVGASSASAETMPEINTVSGELTKVEKDTLASVEPTPTAEVAVTAADVATSQEAVEQAQAAVDAQQAVVETATASFEEAAQANSQAIEQLTAAEEKAIQATPENIASAQATVESAKTSQTSAETATQTAQAAVQTTQAAVDKQATVVASAKEATVKEQSDVALAQNKVSEAEAAFDSETLLKAQEEAGRLVAKVKEEQNTVSNLASSLATREQEQKDLLASGNKMRQDLEQAVTSAGPEYFTEIVERELSKHEVGEGDSISTPKDPTFVGKNGKTYYVAANENVIFDGEKVVTIVLPNKEAFNQRKTVDYKKVSEYVREYIVELRRINGIDIPVPEVTETALKWAKARTDEMSKNNKLSHDTVLVPKEFNVIGETENASMGSLSTESILDEREIAYNELLSYFNDFSNASLYGAENPEEVNIFNYGHRTPLLGATGTGFAIQNTDGYGILTFVSTTDRDVYGVLPSNLDESVYSIFEYDGKVYKNPPYSSYFLARAENKDSDPLRSEYYFNGKRIKFLPKTTFRYIWEETLYHKNTKREEAISNLNNFNTRQTTAEAAIASTISSVKSELATAQQILETDEKALIVANERVSALTADNAEKVRVLKEAQSELSSQQAALKVAKDNQAKEEGTLARLEGLRDQAQGNLDQAKAGLEEVKKTVRSAEQALLALQNAPEKLEEAKSTYAKAQQELNDAKAALDYASALLTTLQAERDTKQSVYQDLKAKFEAAQALAKELEEKAKDNVIMTLPDGTVIALPKDAPTAQEKPVLDINTLKAAISKGQEVIFVNGKVVVDEKKVASPAPTIMKPQVLQSERQVSTNKTVKYLSSETTKTLPNTGSTSATLWTGIGTILALFGLVGIRRRKQG